MIDFDYLIIGDLMGYEFIIFEMFNDINLGFD